MAQVLAAEVGLACLALRPLALKVHHCLLLEVVVPHLLVAPCGHMCRVFWFSAWNLTDGTSDNDNAFLH